MYVFQRKKSNRSFWLFVLPAFLLYFLFFLFPFFQGAIFSFTDWNGITPEIQSRFSKAEFDYKVIKNIKNQENLSYIKKYYVLKDDYYVLREWLEDKRGFRKLNFFERRKIKSIFAKTGIKSIKFIGFGNYKEIFTSDTRFLPSIEKKYSEKKGRAEYKITLGAVGFTLVFTFFNVIFTNLIALFLALALDTKTRSKNILRSLFFMPNVLSLVIVAFIWSFIFKAIAKIPILNIGWLGDPGIAPFSVIMVQVWQGCGYVMLIYLAGLQNIPSDILEVADIDGANGIDKFFKITLPLLLPSFTIALFLTITNSLRCFDIIWVLTNGGPGYATTPIVVDIYNNAFAQNRFGYGTAKAVLLCLIIVAVTVIQLSLMKKKEVEY